MIRKIVLGFALGAACTAQTATPVNDTLRHDLQEATQTSLLESEGMSPFRLVASFDTFDYQGKPNGDGTLVEEWLKPGLLRRVISYRGKMRTEVEQDGKVGHSKSDFVPSFMEEKVIYAMLHPGPSQKRMASTVLRSEPLTIGTAHLNCAILSPESGPVTTFTLNEVPTAYCLSADTRLIRVVEEDYAVQVTYNAFKKQGTRLFAEEVNISQDGVLRARLHVTSLNALVPSPEISFPPPDILDPSSTEMLVPGTTTGGKILVNPEPEEPHDLRTTSSGKAWVTGLLGNSGALENLEVVRAPSPPLAQAALSTAKRIRYSPRRYKGALVETRVVVSYSRS